VRVEKGRKREKSVKLPFAMNAHAQSAEPVDYTGRHINALDGSRRVMLPPQWRRGEGTKYTMLPWPIGSEDRVLVLPPERWREMLTKLKSQSLTNPRVAALEQVIAETAVQVSLDKVGRICLTEDLTKALRVKNEVELVGRLDKFELWNPKAREAIQKETRKLAVDALKEVEL